MRMGLRNKKRTGLVWLLILAMLSPFLPLDGNVVRAESVEEVLSSGSGVQEETIDLGKSNLEVNVGVPGNYNSTSKLREAGIRKLEIIFRVSHYEQSSDGTAGAQAYFGYGENWKHGDWVNLSGGEQKVSIDLSTYTMSGNENIWAFGVQFANVSGSISYEILSAKLIGEKNSQGGSTGGNTGNTYESKANFAKLLQYSLYFYDANMCGGQVAEKSLVASGKKYGANDGYRGNCHMCDSQASYNGKTVDVSGGFHDAGDHAKFNLPQAYSATTLGLAYAEFGEAFEETGQLSHYKTIMEHFCDYFVNCTIPDDAGTGVAAYCYQVGNGGTDHAYWGPPEAQADRSKEAYFTSGAEPCTDIVGETAAALAIHACNFPDDAKSESYLSCAKKLFQYADTMPKASSSGSKAAGFYDGSGWKDDLSLAAIWLYKATGEDTYRSKYEEYVSGLNAGYLNCWDNVSVAALSYGKGWSHTKSSLDSYYNKKVCDGYVYVSAWGSARYNTALQFEGLCHDKNTGSTIYTDWAKEQMNYLLGANSTGRCYVVGYNASSSKNPHHRAASGCASYDDFNNGRTNQKVLLGALCGGISDGSSGQGKDSYATVDVQSDSNYFYHDDIKCYVCNEVALDYNASLVAAASGLYAVSKADGCQMLDTDYRIDASAVCAANPGGDETKEPTQGDRPQPSETKTPEPGSTSAPSVTGTPEPGSTVVPSVTGTPGPGSSFVPSGTETPEPGSTSVPSVTGTPEPGSTSVPSVTGTPGAESSSVPSVTETPGPGSSFVPSGTGSPGSGNTSVSSGNGTSASGNTSGSIVPPSSGGAGEAIGAGQNKIRLSKKKLTVKYKKKGKVVLSGVAKKTKVKLKYPKKKLAVKLKKQTASQKQYQITGKKKGKYTVTFLIGKKKWKLKVVVK